MMQGKADNKAVKAEPLVVAQEGRLVNLVQIPSDAMHACEVVLAEDSGCFLVVKGDLGLEHVDAAEDCLWVRSQECLENIARFSAALLSSVRATHRRDCTISAGVVQHALGFVSLYAEPVAVVLQAFLDLAEQFLDPVHLVH